MKEGYENDTNGLFISVYKISKTTLRRCLKTLWFYRKQVFEDMGDQTRKKLEINYQRKPPS